MSKNKITKVLLGVLSISIIVLSFLLVAFTTRSQKQNTVIPPPTQHTGNSITKVQAVPIPQVVTFANDTLPMDKVYVRESLDRELLVNSYWQSQTLILLKKSKRYFSIIDPILKKYNIPEDFRYLAVAESGLNELAVSPTRAKGLWQIMSSTGKENGLTINSYIDERYHIEKSTIAACKYLNHSYKKFKNWSLVAASYNAGKRGVSEQMKIQGSDSYYSLLLNPETGRYLYRIIAFKIIFNSPEKYHFFLNEGDYYPEFNTYAITVKHSIKNFSTFAKEHGINYKELKYYNPWLRKSYLKNPKQISYQILLPKK